MFSKAIKQITNSFFPIFFEFRRESQRTIGVSGTGFFVDNNGLFVTAYHVITDMPTNSKLLYAGNIPSKIIQPIEIKEVYKDSINDIYLGKIEKSFFRKVKLSKSKPKIGTSICLCGYPMARISLNPDKSINVSQVRKYWQPTFVIDYFKGKIKGRNYKGFMTQHTSLAGMSGGPVFDVRGVVYGMDVATATRRISKPEAPPVVVPNGIVTGTEKIKEIIKLAKKEII